MQIETLDAQGLRCPMPLLQTKLCLNRLSDGDQLLIITTDRGSVRDIPAFAKQVGHKLLSINEKAGYYEITIQKHSGASND